MISGVGRHGPLGAMRIFMVFASRSRSKAAGAPSMLAISEVRSATWRSHVGYRRGRDGPANPAYHPGLADLRNDHRLETPRPEAGDDPAVHARHHTG
jgi:transketolase